MYVDFPAMFGPVIISMLLFLSSMYVSLETNSPCSVVLSMTGCRPFRISSVRLSSTRGFTYPSSLLHVANEHNTSKTAIFSDVFCMISMCFSISSLIPTNISYSSLFILVSALGDPSRSVRQCRRAGVMALLSLRTLQYSFRFMSMCVFAYGIVLFRCI